VAEEEKKRKMKVQHVKEDLGEGNFRV